MAYLQGHRPQTIVPQEVAPSTGSSTTVSPPFDHLIYTNAGTIAAQTVVLPPVASVPHGHVVTISNIAQITALTFSPAVSGWTNGSQLNAGQGIMVQVSQTFATPAYFVLKS